MNIIRKSLFFFVLLTSLFAQEMLLQSGPMVGYSEMREVLLWVQTKSPASVKFKYYPLGDPEKALFTEAVQTDAHDACVAKIAVGNLEPGMRYEYELYINDQKVDRPYPLQFQTQKLWQWREDPPPFSIAVGSCAYINDPPYDRPGKPYGSEYEIFQSIYEKHPDAMLWLGDNVYLREVDWYSRSGILYRYTHTRSTPELQPLLGSVHHYAIWDDHDYGPNNSDRTFRQKFQTLEAFKLFWGNPTFGINGKPGITTMFQWADVDFFLLDNRFYRSPNYYTTGEREMLGEEQLNWLIEALTSSQAPFKIIAIGGQVLNPVARYENYSNYPAELEKLLDAITHENIRGVLFLTGDRHHTEL
ncbi:MAG: alkaline phosphatase family protein, partial [Calditrichaeota bacterium]